jgi:ligand-binding SRPBCC domain-containing protein
LNQLIQFEQWVPVPLERVILLFANPSNLPRIMPRHTETELIRLKLVPPPGIAEECSTVTDRASLAGVGSEIVTSFRVLPFLPFRAKWTALITEFEWNHHFADVQKQGPFKSFHHRHELKAEVRGQATGTIVRDVINYDVGFGWLGTLAQKLVVSRQLRQTFAYRQQALERLLG